MNNIGAIVCFILMDFHGNGKNIRVLIVDDHAMFRQVVRSILKPYTWPRSAIKPACNYWYRV